MEGYVKWFSAGKGFGFIQGDDGKDYFVHQSNILMDGFRDLAEGQRVQFEAGENEKGPQAVCVEVVGGQEA